jgi:hypothetical protein
MDERLRTYVACGIGGVGLLVLLVSGWLSCRSGGNADQQTLPRETYWACQNDACKNTFSISRSDLLAYQKAHQQAPTPPCPKCGKTKVVPAIKCPSCGTIYANPGKTKPVCPKCGKPAVGPA